MCSESRSKILFWGGRNYLLVGLGSGHMNVVILPALNYRLNYDIFLIDLIAEPQNKDDRTYRC